MGGADRSKPLSLLRPVADAELYDPETDTWTRLPPMRAPRLGYHSAVELGNGDVLVVGGGTHVSKDSNELLIGAVDSAEVFVAEQGQERWEGADALDYRV
jgi:hypothetical protein